MFRSQVHDSGFNNNVLVFGPPDTTVTRRVLEATCTFSADENIYKQRNGPDAIMPWTWFWLWNDGLFKACVHKHHCGVARFPVFFTDGYMDVSTGQEDMRPCDPNKDNFGAGQPVPPTLRSVFTWHARFDKFDDACVDTARPTLAGAVRRQIDALLAGGLDMNGRALFGGPGYLG
jgi:hypothetical protein